MPTYAIGDVQGCDRTLGNLLKQIGFRPGPDRLWLVGDLVNRGPTSLEVLRRVADLGDAAQVVLGNHDVYLLARFAGAAARERDTLDAVLAAPDAEALCGWLRTRPLAVADDRHLMVHAGLLPAWDRAAALAAAGTVEAALQGPHWADFVRVFRHDASLAHAAVAALTRLRMVDAHGRPEWKFKGPPEEAPAGWQPWYAQSRVVATGEATVVFGHWAALGFRHLPGVLALDSGCAWGRHLTACRLEDGAVFEAPLADAIPPCD